MVFLPVKVKKMSKKIFNSGEYGKLCIDEKVKYSEEYVASYSLIQINGLTIRKESPYYAHSKNAHKAVMNKFKNDEPTATLINLTYQ